MLEVHALVVNWNEAYRQLKNIKSKPKSTNLVIKIPKFQNWSFEKIKARKFNLNPPLTNFSSRNCVLPLKSEFFLAQTTSSSFSPLASAIFLSLPPTSSPSTMLSTIHPNNSHSSSFGPSSFLSYLLNSFTSICYTLVLFSFNFILYILFNIIQL